MKHNCHAEKCQKRCAPRKLFCLAHWTATPRTIQDAVWRYYREGQEISKTPTRTYCAVQRLACAYHARTEAPEQFAHIVGSARRFLLAAQNRGEPDADLSALFAICGVTP